MRRIERVGNLDSQLQQGLELQWLVRNEMPERLAFQELHHDEWVAIVLSNFMDGADVGMIQSGGCPRFTLKPLQGLAIGRKLVGQELQGDVAAQTQILGLVDDPHASAAESFQNTIMGNRLTYHGGGNPN